MNKPSKRGTLVQDENGKWSTKSPWWINIIPLRVQVAWQALRGRPVAYRLTVHGGLVFTKERKLGAVVDCHINTYAVPKGAVVVEGTPVNV